MHAFVVRAVPAGGHRRTDTLRVAYIRPSPDNHLSHAYSATYLHPYADLFKILPSALLLQVAYLALGIRGLRIGAGPASQDGGDDGKRKGTLHVLVSFVRKDMGQRHTAGDTPKEATFVPSRKHSSAQFPWKVPLISVSVPAPLGLPLRHSPS